nr:HD domain-containing phosphohydrolase [uncultured Desulfobulbus sp.]
MDQALTTAPLEVAQEIDQLFYQRTRICLWLGAVFFSFFSLLDYVHARDVFPLFLGYRLSFVFVLIGLLQLLRFPELQRHCRKIMFGSMLLGTLVISLMTVKLGGFGSGYYVGILLMIAGGFSVLPLNIGQSLGLGGAMYCIYALTVYLGSPPLSGEELNCFVNNTFFFWSIVIVTTVQCFDEIQTLLKSLRIQKNLRTINGELKEYTGGLESLVKERMAQQEESDLKFRDLYNNILDLVVLIDGRGIIQMINHHGAQLLELSAQALKNRPLTDFLPPQDQDILTKKIMIQLASGQQIQGIQMRLITYHGRPLEVELSGNAVNMPEQQLCYQLIIRDITLTKQIEKQVLESKQLLDTSRQAAIFGLASLAECRDEDTGAHLLRIRAYTRILAMELALSPDAPAIITDTFIEDLCISSMLHDIGKIGIPDSILLKPARLTREEFTVIKQHCELGSNALASAERDSESLSFLRLGQEITRCHHERWDGTGYPSGLKGEKIPLAARIVSLVDVYDALTSTRPYKEAFSHEESCRIILSESGHLFDPVIVAAFLRREQDFDSARQQMYSTPILPVH